MQRALPVLRQRTDLATIRDIALYIVAIVAANLITARLGPDVSIATAFLLVGLNFTVLDRLHDAWRGPWLAPRMATLIGLGSILSWALNRTAGQIGAASFVAFLCSNLVDRGVYALLIHRPRWRRCNWSNLASTQVDSILFPLLAFPGPLDLEIVRGQFLAKLAGAMLWSLLLLGRDDP